MRFSMWLVLAPIVTLSPMLAGCLAHGAEPGGGDVFGNIILRILEMYGPMAGMILWFMHREKLRDERDAAQRAEFIRLIESCTSVMVEVKTKLAQTCTETEKTRVAVYQVKDIVQGKGKEIVMPRANESHQEGRGSEGAGNSRMFLKD